MQPKRLSAWGGLLAAVVILLAATLVGALCATMVRMLVPSLSMIETGTIAYASQFGLAIAGVWVFYRRRGEEVLRGLSLRWYDAPVILGGIVVVTAAGVVLEPVLTLFPDHYLDSLAEMLNGGGWAIVLSVVLAPLCEEIFFRALVLERLSRRWSAGWAVAASALFFGLVHLPNLPQALNAIVVGVVLGYVYVLTRSLVPVVAIHALNNAAAWLIATLTGSQNTDTRELVANDTLYWTVFGVSAAVCVVAFVGMWYFGRRVDTKWGGDALGSD